MRLRFRDCGEGDPAIVFVHGWGCNHLFFGPQMEHFSTRHRVVAPDQRGFGASDKPEQDYTIEGFADDLRWLCAEIGVERAILVGHSLGGAVALAAAARDDDLVAALVLCDPAVFLPDGAAGVYDELVKGLASERAVEAAREFAESYLFLESDDVEKRAWIVDQMCATPPHVLHSAFHHLRRFDADAAARACRVPVLRIDAAQPVADPERFRAACPHVVAEHTPDVGHFHQLLAPGRVNAILERFIAGAR